MSGRRPPILTPLLLMLLAAAAIGAAGCDRDAPPSHLVTTRPSQPVIDVNLKPLTPLLPSRSTHLTVDPLGNLYWVQETDRGDDTMFVIGDGDIPRATQLSAGNIGAALGAGDDARGSIQGIAAGPTGEIYFYFRGTAGRRALAAIGQFQPKTAQIRILADEDALEKATGMGKSLTLAGGSVVSDLRFVWTWIRHTDGWCIFRFDPRDLPPDGPVQLSKPFTAVKLGGESVSLTRDEYQLSPAPNSELFLLDPVGARLLRIDQSGQATVALSLLGLPGVLSPPVVDRSGKLILFAANAPWLRPANPDDPRKMWKLDVPWPAMLLFNGDDVKVIARDNIQAYPGFPVFGLKVTELVPGGPSGGESWIAYDSNSGEVLRATLHERNWP